MQLAVAQKGVSTRNQLSDSLKVYLNNRNRLQPIIGLGSITECVKAGTHYGHTFYLCEVCVCRLSKADIRNHIMGSLHRYNYIKAWHPHLVSEWKEDANLSQLAWPLMEKAKIIEGKEGPGDIQLLEVEDAVYQRMATCSENDAVTLINILRDGQGEPDSHSDTTSVQLEQSPTQSHRIVLFAQNQPTWLKKSFGTSAETNAPPPPAVKSEGWFNNTAASLSGDSQTSPETSVLSESSSFLDAYTGAKPLIGLFRVVECRSEDGHTYCYLCHCCRVRSNKKDVIDHLTSSSHLLNYLMETHPEQVEEMTDINDNYQLLQSLAKKVEQEEGRGELKVINAPESLCILLTGKSYHWCIKMLCNGRHTDIQKRKTAGKGPNEKSNQGMPEKCAVMMRMAKKNKKRNTSNTVFKVSLPLTKGPVLLQRTSFSMDSLPVSPTYSPPSDLDLIPSPESQSEDYELDCDTGSFAVNHAEHTSTCTTPQLQQGLYSGDADTDQYRGPEKNFVGHYQEVDGDFSHNEYLNPSEHITGERNSSRQHRSQERSSKRLSKEWQKDQQTHSEWLSSAAPPTQEWSPYTSSYGRVEGCTEQWYNSASHRKGGTSVEVSREQRQEMSSNATQYYYRQQPQYQYTTRDHVSLLTGSVGQHGLSGESLPHLNTAWINMHTSTNLGEAGNIAPQPGAQFFQTPWQTYMGFAIGHVQTAPQSYMAQPTFQQAIQVGHAVMSNPNYNTEPTTTPDQHISHPTVVWTPR